jgi:aminoglycoside phosphotransferase (APT) family kinase protein
VGDREARGRRGGESAVTEQPADAPGGLAGLDLPALQAWFDAVVPGHGPLRAQSVHGGRSNLTFRLTDGRSAWVLRRPPLGGWTPSAHDMAREYRVVAALADADVPVARAVALCDDPSVIGVPFLVAEFVDGRVLRSRDDLDTLSDAEVERCAFSLVEVLGRLHAVDPVAVGLAGFGKPAGYLGRQVRRWHDQWTRVATTEIPDVEALHAELERTCPAESGASIVHGDFRIDNTILDPADPAAVRAVVDWEMATLGDPLADLGLHLTYRDPTFDAVLGEAAATSPRQPTPGALAAHYAAVTGRDVGGLSFYLGLGYFKAAIIAAGIHARHVQGHTVGDGFEGAGTAVAPLAAAGLAALRTDDGATSS